MKENVFNPDQMAVIVNSLIYTHVRKQKAFMKQCETDPDCGRACALEKVANETMALIRHISDNSDPHVRDFIHEQLKDALA